jgi:hypothetical protein
MIKKDVVKIALVPCSRCGRVFKAEITQDILNDVERYPFTIVLMHVSVENGKKEIHTLVAYLDKSLNCRHVTVLLGRRLFITPYVLYNPNLLILSCNRSLTKNNYIDDVKT